MADLPNTQLNQNQVPNNQPNKKEEIKEFEEEVVPNATNIKAQETFTLPSKGLVYASGNPKTITLRRMTIREDKIRLKSEGESKIRRDILQACTLDKDVDIGQLTLFDSNYLLFCLRRISLLNNTYKVSLTCPYCDTEFVDEIDLSKLKIKYATPETMPNMDIVLPVSKAKIRLKFPTLTSTSLFYENLGEYMKSNSDEELSELLYTYADILYIEAINGNRVIFEELEDFINNLDILDIRFLKEEVRKLDGVFGIDEDILCKCPQCKRDIHHGLPITNELFSPTK